MTMESPPATGRFAFVYKAELARNAKTEAEYFATLHVIPSATKAFGPSDAQLVDYGFSLAMEAIRGLDPEMGSMAVTPIGDPGFTTFHETGDLVPALRKNGWTVYIDWSW